MFRNSGQVLVLTIFSLLNLTAALSEAQQLSTTDKFDIFAQMNLHQTYIDHGPSYDNAKLYANLYWPNGTFRVIDPDGRDVTMTGHVQIRSNDDHAHSVFPLYQWRHSMGVFEIFDPYTGSSGDLTVAAHWKWRVDWRANTTGVVSTGYYDDVYEKRDGVWKVLHRTSRDDPNWPIYVFAPYVANQNNSSVSSCGDTSL